MRWLHVGVGGLLLAVATSAPAEPVSLVFVGDLMLDDGPGRQMQHGSQCPECWFAE